MSIDFSSGGFNAELKAIMDGKLRVRELVEKIGDVTDYTWGSVI